MKTGYIVVGVGLVVVVGVVGWLMLSGGSAPVAESTQTYLETPTEIPPVAEQLTGQDTLMNLLGLGKTLECSFQFKDDGNQSEGTGFFEGNKMRVDMMYTATSSEVFTSNMINDGATMYLWSDTEEGKFAMKMSATPDAASGQASPPDVPLDAATKVWYTCKPWNVDGSVFEAPQDVTFMDMSSMQQQMRDLQRGVEDISLPTSE